MHHTNMSRPISWPPISVRDVVIGMADGLTVPFALAAGLSGAVQNTRLIVVGGLAEIAAGSIAMGLGGYLAARGDAEHYEQEREREYREIKEIPEEEMAEVGRVFQSYGMTQAESTPVVEALSRRPDAWVDFMMRFELGLEEPDPKPRGHQRRHDRRLLYCGRTDSAFALHPSFECRAWARVFRGRDPGRARNFRISERPLHGNRAGAQRIADHGDRRRGGSGGFCVGQTDFVRCRRVARAPSPARSRDGRGRPSSIGLDVAPARRENLAGVLE